MGDSRLRRTGYLVLAVVTVAGLEACAATGGLCWFDCGSSHAGSTPLVDYLYPQGDVPKYETVPVLKVPLHVGLSFLPDANDARHLPASDKARILDRLRERFRSLDYVGEIVIIPDSYLSPKGGFDGLAQLARLQSLDVVALVSYDQVAELSENRRSLMYLTIVGGYFVRGSHGVTSTLLDLAVVEPGTRSLLVRAGGTSVMQDTTTAMERQEQLRHDSANGLDQATDELMTHLDEELKVFSARVRAGDGPVRVVKRGQSAGGGGALTLPWLLLLAGLAPLSRGCRCGSRHP